MVLIVSLVKVCIWEPNVQGQRELFLVVNFELSLMLCVRTCDSVSGQLWMRWLPEEQACTSTAAFENVAFVLADAFQGIHKRVVDILRTILKSGLVMQIQGIE